MDSIRIKVFVKPNPTSDFLNNLLSYSFVPLIRYPTRITETSATLIDNIFVNCINLDIDSSILYSDISDHLPVATRIVLSSPRKDLCSINIKRFYSNDQYDSFNLSLADVDCSDINMYSDNPSQTYSIFVERFCTLFDKFFPQ